MVVNDNSSMLKPLDNYEVVNSSEFHIVLAENSSCQEKSWNVFSFLGISFIWNILLTVIAFFESEISG